MAESRHEGRAIAVFLPYRPTDVRSSVSYRDKSWTRGTAHCYFLRMKVVVATHGHCFDGLSSATLFTRLLKELEGAGTVAFSYHACGYGIGQNTATPQVFDGQHNAILDYRFTATNRLNWYFDHHRTAFGSPADESFFRRREAPGRFVYDPTYSSCAKLIYDTAKTEFGLRFPELESLVAWADKVDSANFASAEEAVLREDPILRLVSVVERFGNSALMAELTTRLQSEPLEEIALSPRIQAAYAPIGARFEKYQDLVRSAGETLGRVVLVDLTAAPLESIGKFVTYAQHPKSMYSVVVARLKRGFKLSVGYNPWCGQPLDADISQICARYGGGGHPVVGGISLPEGQRQRAQDIAREIAVELDSAAN